MNKILDNLQFKVFTDIVEKSEKDGKRRIRGYASTDALDRQGEVISIEALQQAANHLLENPTVFYEHKHDTYPVGLCVASKIDDKGLLVDVEISQTADTLWTLIQEGILNRFSIGGRVTSSEERVDEDKKPYNEITGIELFEVSVVGLPANPEARFEVVNKSFSMVIADEIKKRKEGSVVEKEIKKVEEVKVEPTKKVEDTLTDSQKKDLEKYEVEDKAKASEKPKEEKETTEKSQEAKPKEIVENKTEKKVVEGEKVEEQKEVVKDTKEVEAKEEKVAEAKTEPVETVKVEEKVTTTDSDTTTNVDKTNGTVSDDTSTIQINLLPDKKVDETKSEVKEEKSEDAIVEEKPAEEKPEIKADNSIVTDEEFEKLVTEDVSKPYPNEHAARIRPVSDFQEGSFRSKLITEGVRIIVGRLIGETTTTVQSYRFHVDHFTSEEAKQWLKDHDITYILFEPAKKSEELEEKPEENKEGEPAEEKKEDELVFEHRVLTEEKVLELLKQLSDKIDALGEKINAIELANQARIAEKAPEAGQGQGQGNPRQGDGGRDTCYCPKCDKKVTHERGTPCIEQVCPDCGGKLLPEKAKEKKEEAKAEKKVKEKPQRKSFIADAPYANDKKDNEKKDTSRTTDKGWTQILYGTQK